MRPFGAKPLDWTRGGGRAAAVQAARVDVIVPVYGAAADLERCLESIARCTDLAGHGLVLVIDGPQPPPVDMAVDAFVRLRPSAVTVLRNEARRGFVASANRGMRHARGDVILLNSDTVVTERWVEKLIAAAASHPDVGTVTPLSNHATLCSVPQSFVENLLPSGHDVDSFGTLVERASARTYLRLPTGVGVCMYIRRALIDDVGFFDEGRFGFGYGEENDFCMRALARGWLHVADDATFVYHAGGKSFAAEGTRLRRAAARTMARLHPAYMPTIARFMEEDPLGEVRARVQAALRSRAPRLSSRGPGRVAHVVHGWPPFQQAGTELYAYWLVQRQLAWREVSVFARMDAPARAQGERVELDESGARIQLITNNFVQRDPVARNAIHDAELARAFDRFLEEERPDLVHVHHLSGHCFSLTGVARRRKIPIVLQLQDFWSFCGRVSLMDRGGERCSGPALAKCAACVPLTAVRPARAWSAALHLLRSQAGRRAVASADACVMGSLYVRETFLRAGCRPGVTTYVLPYGVDLAGSASPRRPARRPLRFGCIGSILPHKGLHVACEAFRDIAPSEATLHVWGNPEASPEYSARLRELAGGASLSFEGRFAEEDRAKVVSTLDVLLVPSVGSESFGLAAREAMACGVPVIASRGGALEEMFEPGTCGELFPVGDWRALRAVIRRLVDRPSIIDEWSARIPAVKTVGEHALEIEDVYARVLEARGR